ncbi:hypothetical protein [Actinomadura livida]|uniref:Uncharacterized protein n=1 Tax=Actinomadura livida TaxID=79909 RepID=A0A7W7I6U2_9ACTN|nr:MULTISPECIES: hypothetical protein [Actinomadura]MBB4771610.1 hypothetical protein [Actinomadura catellatispora]GGU01373.1 hypothetical protein GCM10010208_26310 [Actinomadura livida]
MLVDHFPLLGLRLSTPRLELRLPSSEELATLAELAAEGIHAVGYRPDGLERHMIRGALPIDARLRLSRAAWYRHRTTPVTIEGLEPCLPVLGLSST